MRTILASPSPGWAAVLVLVVVGPAAGATVVFDVAPASSPLSSSLTVQAGSEVDYILTVVVLSDDPDQEDNSGLASFETAIETNLGLPQGVLSSFDSLIEENFTVGLSLGIAQNDDIVQITGQQPESTSPQTGVAQDDVLVLAEGTLTTPSLAGTYTVRVSSDSTATVFKTDYASLPNTESATVLIGGGFTITTESGSSSGSTVSADSSSGTSTSTAEDIQKIVLATGALLVVMGLGYWLGGPLGFIIGLFLGSIVGLAILGVNPATSTSGSSSSASVPALDAAGPAVAITTMPGRTVEAGGRCGCHACPDALMDPRAIV